MFNFENRVIRGMFTSQYVASWAKSYPVKSGRCHTTEGFKMWLEQLVIDGEKLTEEEIKYIIQFATTGKFELECNIDEVGSKFGA
jgi:hypothetical protein